VDPNSLLSQLRDAHSPDPVGIWPLAPGWWFLILLGLILLVALCVYGLRAWRSTIWKRQARSEFNRIRQAYLSQPGEMHLIALNQLMKRTLCSAKRSREYMHYAEHDWANALSSVKVKGKPILQEADVNLLSREIYHPQQAKLDDSALMRIAQWIKQC
jgi:hypothetical protein